MKFTEREIEIAKKAAKGEINVFMPTDEEMSALKKIMDEVDVEFNAQCQKEGGLEEIEKTGDDPLVWYLKKHNYL